MGAILKLTKGLRSLDLMSAPYDAGKDFKPPATAYNVGLAGGGSANVTGGAMVYTRKYINQEFSFQIRIDSTSDGGVNAGVRALNAMLALAGDELEPLYLEYNSSDSVPEPLWGQFGANYRYPIVTGTLSGLWDMYGESTTRARTAFVTVQLTIKPFALGNDQALATATGGVIEDVIGSTDGRSLGLVIPLGACNLVPNPVFGNATYNSGWNTAASAISASTVDKHFVIPGTLKSAYISNPTATCLQALYTNAITTVTGSPYNLSCYAKLSDSASIGASTLFLYYTDGTSGSLVPSYTALGDGWYRLSASRAAVFVDTQVGVYLQPGKAAYVSGFQLEPTGYVTPLAVGDFLGNTWGALNLQHSGSTLRTAGQCYIGIGNDTLFSDHGSIRVVVRFDVDNTYLNDMYLFDTRDGTHANALALYFDSGTDAIYVVSGGTEVIGKAVTFSARTTYVLHVTWDSRDNVCLYVNGSQVDRRTYTAYAMGTNLYICSAYTGSLQVMGAVTGFATFDRALTSTQVAADYNNCLPLVNRSEKVEPVPWFWTDDGDNILSLDTGKTPRGVINGIPGTAPADTTILGTLSSAWNAAYAIGLSNFLSDYHFPYDWNSLFTNLGGTAATNAYNNDVSVFSISTSASDTFSTVQANLSLLAIEACYGKEFYALARLKAASSAGVTLDAAWNFGEGVYLRSNTRTVTMITSYRLWRSKPLVVRSERQRYGLDTYVSNSDGYANLIGLEMAASTGTLSASVDYLALAARPFVVLGNASMASTYTGFALRGSRASVAKGRAIFSSLPVTGDTIEFEPGKYNILLALFGLSESIDPVTTLSLTLDKITVTPRYLLL